MLKDLCFEIIQACPNNCMFCSSKSFKNAQPIIDIELFKKTVEYFIKNGGVEEISLSGGEPFLHPDLIEMVKFCKENNLRTVIFTSGIRRAGLITKPELNDLYCIRNEKIKQIQAEEPDNIQLINRVKKFYNQFAVQNEFGELQRKELDKLKQLGLDKIVFDYQAAEEETYNMLMGTRNFITMLMKSIVQARAAGLTTDVHFIPMNSNYKQLPDLIDLLNIVGVENLSILNFVPQGRGKENLKVLKLQKEEEKEFKEIFEFCKDKFNGKLRIGIPLLQEQEHLCTAGLEKINIRYDGTILPCPAFKEIHSETLQKFGIDLYNIRQDLEKMNINGGTRKHPLCKQIYGFDLEL